MHEFCKSVVALAAALAILFVLMMPHELACLEHKHSRAARVPIALGPSVRYGQEE